MSANSYLQDFRNTLLARSESVGELEYTAGNYDGKGNLIPNPIPTVATDACEVGIYGDTIYFTFIILASDFKKELFDCLAKYNNVQIYPFKDFNDTLYPKPEFDYSEFERQLKNDKYLQVNFNDDYKQYSVKEIMEKYLEYKDIFLNCNIKPIQIRQGWRGGGFGAGYNGFIGSF